MIKIDLSYVSPGSSFVHPLYTESGQRVLEPRVIITREMISQFLDKYGPALFYTPGQEKVRIPHYRIKIAYNGAREILDEIGKTNKLSKKGYQAAERVVDEILSDLSSMEIEAIDLLKELSGFDDYLYNHSVNVGFLATVFAMRSGYFTHDEVRSLSLGAYLHDIGHKEIDTQLLNKEGAFDASEFQKIKRHPQLGYEMIKKVDNNDPIVQQSVLFHHEKFNGNGYYQLPYENLPLFPKIISICDIYDALTTPRPFRKTPFSNAQALRAILNTVDSIFDGELVDRFMRVMPKLLNTAQGELYAPGEICALSTMELALIDTVHDDDPMHPEVSAFCGFRHTPTGLSVQYYNTLEPKQLKDTYITKIITNDAQLDNIRKALRERGMIR